MTSCIEGAFIGMSTYNAGIQCGWVLIRWGPAPMYFGYGKQIPEWLTSTFHFVYYKYWYLLSIRLLRYKATNMYKFTIHDTLYADMFAI